MLWLLFKFPNFILFYCILLVGDRLLTDVAFANKYGMLSVFVAPLSYTKDHPVAVVLRYVHTQF